jgi:uncharacterized protein (TIGR00266 family)
MKTDMPGGLFGGLARMAMGESIFMTTYTCHGEQAEVTFTPDVPGAIIPLDLGAGQSIVCQRGSFMCGQQTVTMQIHIRQRLGVGLFGGEGFILQRITGPGMAFFEIDGEVIEMELAAGETMRVDPGHIAMFDTTVTSNIEMVKGIANIFLGGEGLFLATLTGPGRVWLQTMPVTKLIDLVVARIPKSG